MKKYLRVYFTLLRLNISTLIVYPANFYNSLLAAIAWGFFSLYSIVLLTFQIKSVFGWSRNEILLLNGIYGVLIGVFHTVFSRNFERFSSVIHQGQLDSVLIKPIDSQFLLSFWMFGWTTISRVIISLGYVFILFHALSLQVTILQVFMSILFGILGISLLYSIWYIIITLTIWFTRLSNLVELMFNITGIARYPREMFAGATAFTAWFLLPLLLIINIPTKVYLDRLNIQEVLLLVLLSAIVFIISRKFWFFALKFYTSASS